MISARPVTAASGIAAGQPLGGGDQIRHDTLVLAGEPRSGAGDPGLHLVGDQHDAAVAAELGDRRRKPSAGTMNPPSPWIGSTTTQATASAPIWASTSWANWLNASAAQFSGPDGQR